MHETQLHLKQMKMKFDICFTEKTLKQFNSIEYLFLIFRSISQNCAVESSANFMIQQFFKNCPMSHLQTD